LNNEPSQLDRILVEERRLAILRWLWKMPGHTANERIAGMYLRHVGLVSAQEAVRDCLNHLERSGALKIVWREALMVIELTHRGVEAADGLIEVDGIPRPGVDCPY
jgi:hypothetical protein